MYERTYRQAEYGYNVRFYPPFINEAEVKHAMEHNAKAAQVPSMTEMEIPTLKLTEGYRRKYLEDRCANCKDFKFCTFLTPLDRDCEWLEPARCGCLRYTPDGVNYPHRDDYEKKHEKSQWYRHDDADDTEEPSNEYDY